MLPLYNVFSIAHKMAMRLAYKNVFIHCRLRLPRKYAFLHILRIYNIFWLLRGTGKDTIFISVQYTVRYHGN